MGESNIEMEHARIGELQVREESIIHFDGLPGFPEARRFALVSEGGDDRFQWLACLDDPELAFVVTDPQLFFPDYAPKLGKAHLRALGAEEAAEVVFLAIANLSGDVPRLNLAAPLVVHPGSRRAAQTVLDDPELSVAEALPREEASQIESNPQT